MRKVTAAAITVFVAAAAAGCSLQLDEARNADPSGSAFDRALYKGYLALAQAELDETDLVDAKAFARRAVMAANGKTVLPEAIRHRMLAPATAKELSDARGRLMAALAAGARAKFAGDAARAQVSFDCWIQEQEENIQPGDIASCRRAFLGAVARIEASTAPPRVTAASARVPLTAAPQLTAGPAPSVAKREFVVLFGHDSAALTPQSRRMLDDAIAAARESGVGVVVVSGHADRSGRANHNMTLGDRRARAVAGVLNRVLDTVTVETRSFGEDRPAINTEDGVREPRNRRVEIDLSGAIARTASTAATTTGTTTGTTQ